jgi:integrase
MELARKKVGRLGGRKPVEFVKHPDTDQPVAGLRSHKSSGRYYRIENGKDRFHYKKKGLKGIAYLRRAIYEHECWSTGSEPTSYVEVVARQPAYNDFGTEIPVIGTFTDDGRAVNVYQVGKEDLAAYFRDQISNPETRAEFARSVNVPELVNLTSLPPVARPLPLQDVIDNYIRGKSFKYKRQYRDATRCWTLFTDSVGVHVADEIDSTHLQRFHKALRNAGEPRTQKNILLIVQSILKYGADIFKNHRALLGNLKLEIRRICSWETQKHPTPKPMKKASYLQLLKQCEDDGDLMWKAIFITSLNLGLHPTEMADLDTSEFDLEELVFTSNRTKTGVARVATLWRRTVNVLRAYMKTAHFKSNKSPLLFTTANPDKKGRINCPLKVGMINDKIRKIRKVAGLDHHVVFDGIRDLFRTSAGAENIVAIRWAMGHTMGEDDTYAFRDPKETGAVMAKVEKAVFGGPEKLSPSGRSAPPVRRRR